MQDGDTNRHVQVAPGADEDALAILKEGGWLRKGDHDTWKHKADQSALKKDLNVLK